MNLNINIWGISALIGVFFLGRYIAKREIEQTLGVTVKSTVEDKLHTIRTNLDKFLYEKFGDLYSSQEEIDSDVTTVIPA